MVPDEARLLFPGVNPEINDGAAHALDLIESRGASHCRHASVIIERISHRPQIEDQATRILELISTLEDLLARR